MNEKDKRRFSIATCITSYSVILTNMNTTKIDDVVIASIVGTFLILVLIVIAFVFVKLVEDKVIEVDEGDEDDE